jgi:HlyD family secretion protein
VIVGQNSYEVAATLTSAQAAQVNVGNKAVATVDGTSRSVPGSVVQVGPVAVSSGSYSYPVVVGLPVGRNFFDGSTAEVNIVTSVASGVTAVPTSAVHTLGTLSYVLAVGSNGTAVRKDVKVGTVGGEYTEISSGVDLGQRVILADMAQPVPTSNTSTSFRGGGLGGAGLGGGAGGFGGSRLSGGFGGASAGGIG